ncbi:MAG: hypothetical protein PVF75_01185 [Granulosicoccaceae bacterium]|jgi:heterodisulfide reductase subunit A-like polyferredoxin
MADVIATNETILVGGGGISGMTAVLEAAECGKAVEAEFDDEYNYGMKKRKGAWLPHKMAYPMRYVIDSRIIGTDDATKAKEACKYEAIDLEQQEDQMPIVYYSTLMAVAYGKSDKETGLDGQVIKAKQLDEIATK